MSALSSRRAAMSLVAALAVAPAAARAELVPSPSPIVGDAQGLTSQAVQDAQQIARDANSLAGNAAVSAHATTRHTLKFTDATVGNTVLLTVRTVRGVVVSVYGVLEPVGQTTGGRNAASVTSPTTGDIVVSWQTARSGCATFAVSNGLAMPVQRISSNSVKLLRRNTRAAAGSGRVSVNVIC